MASIVVGVDGSDSSKAALRWALEEGRLRGCTVEAVYAWEYSPAPGIGPAPAAGAPVELLRRSAKDLLEAAIADAGGATAGVDVRAVAIEGPATAALVEAAERAELVVVGSRGRGGFAGLLLGSVSHQVSQHASCPVVIVRARGQ